MYVTTEEYNKAMKEYHNDWAVVQGVHEPWVRWEQVEGMCHSADRLQCKATEWAKKCVQVESPDDKPPKSSG